MFVSEYFELKNELQERGVFDSLLDKDSNFFINIVRLKDTEIPEFKEAYIHLNNFFCEIIETLSASSRKYDVFYRRARAKFVFKEVNGINLGFAKTNHGAGFGTNIQNRVFDDAYDIIKQGVKDPEIFHLVGLFEENVAHDRLSDMIATIILPEIEKYTLRMYSELGITAENYPNCTFDKSGLAKNPFKKAQILLLPVEILHELPITKDWEDINVAIHENKIIREEMNIYIGEQWCKWSISKKKDLLKKVIFMNPDAFERVLKEYQKLSLPMVDFKSNIDYCTELIFKDLKRNITFSKNQVSEDNSFNHAMQILKIFKNWIEYNKGWDVIQSTVSRKREKIVQRLFHLSGITYAATNNLDLTFESDLGRGPIDVKVSRGIDKTLIEIKLSSNAQYLHGYSEQIQEYGKAESATNLIYVFIDLGNPRRKEKIVEVNNYDVKCGIKCPKLVIIDATEKQAASTYCS